MKRNLLKKVIVSLVAFAMVVGMLPLRSVQAAVNEVPTFESGKYYALVSTSANSALKATGISWTDTGALFFNGDIEGGKVKANTAFTIALQSDGNYVFTNVGNAVNLKCETGIDFVFNLETGTGTNFKYTIEPVEGGYKLYSLGGQSYLGLGANNRLEKVAEANAEVFTFEEVTILNESVKIKHVASGKYVKAYPDNDTPVTVDGEATDADVVYTPVYGDGVMNFISKSYQKGFASAKWADDLGLVRVNATKGASGWESIIVLPNGDGTVSFKDCEDQRYITVDANNNMTNVGTNDLTADTLTDQEKFILETDLSPKTPKNLAVKENTLEATSVGLVWDEVKESMYSGYELQRKEDGGIYETIATTTSTEYTDSGLAIGGTYVYRVRAVNGLGETKTVSEYSDELTVTTLGGVRPVTPTGLDIEEKENTLEVTWEAVEGADKYEIFEAVSGYGEYTKVAETTSTSYQAVFTKADKYYKNYKVRAVNAYGESALTTDFVSLETKLFGDHTLIFAETDDFAVVDQILLDLYRLQHDPSADAQFKADHYQVYFKPGDYSELSCIYLGFYTSINGLGTTPYDVKLNNLAIPAYLSDYNATCNFWRSAENFSIMNTGNEQGKAQEGSWRADWFNWGVAQAAPLRRVYSERPVAYDWNYGWASGGYVADCYFAGVDGEGNSAGTWSGQQFYTRNTVLKGNAFGTTLNNFFQGVEASNLPSNVNEAVALGWLPLEKENGYSNWNVADGSGNQQVFTSITETEKLSEKPFLFLEDGEYKVFVPSVEENTRGISWGEGKDNNGMGKGEILSLDEFYIASEEDSAAKINEEIAAGKHIYFTPGIYHAETPILVNTNDTILLGSALSAIVPDNSEGAIKVGDVKGVRIVGLMLDAGAHSEYLLTVGNEGVHNDASDNPVILQDLFFRVGGTTDTLTKADNALIINSDDVIGDHFWIWRADHGAGVEWYGNESQHGLIVNGDDVTCYALFNEHFQSYHTKWNGNNGATYFYQNETAYDPISQEAWMSHNGTVNGYASYKVDNDVTSHYAVGFGIYNVFIYTGPEYNSSVVQIQLDNAIEVPNAEGVLVENACTQTFANEGASYQIINTIINGVGDSVSSGIDLEDPTIKGEGWSRKFVLSYNNGTAVVGKYTDGSDAQKGKYLGVDTLTDVKQLGDDNLDLEGLQALVDSVEQLDLSLYTDESIAVLEEAKANALSAINNEDDFLKYALEEDVKALQEALEEAVKALTYKEANYELVDEMVKEYESMLQYKDMFTESSWQAYEDAYNAVVYGLDITRQEEVQQMASAIYVANSNLEYVADYTVVDEAIAKVPADLTIYTEESVNALQEALNNVVRGLGETKQEEVNAMAKAVEDALAALVVKEVPTPEQPTPDDDKVTDTGDMTMIMPYAILAVSAAGAYISLKKERA